MFSYVITFLGKKVQNTYVTSPHAGESHFSVEQPTPPPAWLASPVAIVFARQPVYYVCALRLCYLPLSRHLFLFFNLSMKRVTKKKD